MVVQNYMPFAEFKLRYPIDNHSFRVYVPIIGEYPTPTDLQNYVDHTYFAEGYVS